MFSPISHASTIQLNTLVYNNTAEQYKKQLFFQKDLFLRDLTTKDVDKIILFKSNLKKCDNYL